MSRFAQEFKAERRKHKLTQSGVAEVLGVTTQAVKYWEKARNFPNIVHMTRIINLFVGATMLMHYWNRKL